MMLIGLIIVVSFKVVGVVLVLLLLIILVFIVYLLVKRLY